MGGLAYWHDGDNLKSLLKPHNKSFTFEVPIESELPAYCAYIIKVSNIISQQRISTNLSCPEAR